MPAESQEPSGIQLAKSPIVFSSLLFDQPCSTNFACIMHGYTYQLKEITEPCIRQAYVRSVTTLSGSVDIFLM
jgi:hypothetical protein